MTELTFNAGTRGIGYAMVALSAAEIVAVELMVPWPTVRLVLTGLGIVSLVWILWFLRAQQRRTHLVTATEVVLRAPVCGEVSIAVPAIGSVRTIHRAEDRDGVSLAADALVMATTGTTNVELALVRPTQLVSQQVKALSSGGGPVRTVRFYADDAQRAMRAIQAVISPAR